jgi:NAD(P)-dependent dehydrogenase (short-subunit alcohol dehydrogenase family)
MRLRDKTALVTGAGRGIGRAVALAFAREGCDLLLTARTAGELEETASLARAEGRRAETLTADLANPEAVACLADAALRLFGGVDILVNNAGYAVFKPFLEYTQDDWQRTLDVNLTAPFLLTQRLAPAMIARGGGRVINISSVAGLKPIPEQSAYCASKHGLNGLSKVLAMELRSHGVGVHWICPGGVDTRLAQEAMPDRDKSGWMTPEDIAGACLFVATLGPRATVDEIMIRRFDSVPLGG